MVSLSKRRSEDYDEQFQFDAPKSRMRHTESLHRVRQFYTEVNAVLIKRRQRVTHMLQRVPASTENARETSQTGYTIASRRNSIPATLLEMQVVTTYHLGSGFMR
jgi:hypothetical protein